ncbi:Kelch repeat-containing protein [Maribacter halichondriae]|uniref:Kelch repeat-containing protein n=1 Tax=Maribacter halichondriae TaxID=2980554 RepID=UPI002359F586|nr:hypothetical protein [Maribacter sp. Hal144]
MKKCMVIIGIGLLGLSMGCKKNDDAPPVQIALQNEPPLSFDLIDVPDGSEDVDVTPTLSWESAKNPKGGEVTYDLYLGSEVNPTTLFQGDINDASFEITDRLHLLTDYYWKVVAKDTDGKTSQSAIHKFTTRTLNFPAEAVNNEANFTARSGHAATAFNNELWVIGGYDGHWKNDIWKSSDGVTWTEVIPTNPFPERRGHTITVFKDRLWVIGGYDGNAAELPFNDVWVSNNGVDWELVTASAPFSERENHTSVVFDDKIWIIAGDHDASPKNDVWYSSDGQQWKEATPNAQFKQRRHHTSVVFDNKIWVLGGLIQSGLNPIYENDVWFSSDGADWVEATSAAPF